MYTLLTTAGGKEVGEVNVKGEDIVEVSLTLFGRSFVLTDMAHPDGGQHTSLSLNGDVS